MKKNLLIPFLICSGLIMASFLLFPHLEQIIFGIINDVHSNTGTYMILSFIILSLDIILPVPSSIILYFNGYILGAIPGSLLSLSALMASAVSGYYIGYLTSRGLKAEQEDKTNRIVTKYGVFAILLTRGIPVLSESICLLCGYNRFPAKHYLIYNLVGYFPICLLYASFGSAGYNEHIFLLSFSCVFLLSAGLWLLGNKIATGSQKMYR